MTRNVRFQRSCVFVFICQLPLIVLCLFANGLLAQSQSLLSPALSGSSPQSPFAVAPSLPLVNSPTSVASGHLTASGNLDLVTADYASGTISVFLGIGKGSFASPVSYAAGAHPTSLLIADFDGDGITDVLLANESEGVVSLFPGHSDGTLGERRKYSVGFPPGCIVSGAFSSTHGSDIAVAGRSTKTLAILRNDGSGNFTESQVLALPQTPAGLVVADFNHDGHPDIAVVNANGTVTLLLGEGNSQFSVPREIALKSPELSSIATGDFDRDGIPDLAVTSSTQHRVSILVGKGDGTFSPGPDIPVGASPMALYVADIDQDGIPDLLVVNKGSNTFSVLDGVGDGSFKEASHYVVGNAPVAASIGRFYGGTAVDLVTVNSLSRSLSIPAGNVGGTFAAGRAYAAGLQPVSVASGDIDSDGNPDLVVANDCTAVNSCVSGEIAILLGDPHGGYSLSSRVVMGGNSVSVSLFDVNRDGKLDLLSFNRTDRNVAVRLGSGDGTFGPLNTFALSGYPISLVSADINRDGSPDLAVVEDCGSTSCSEPGQVEVLLGTGTGVFKSVSTQGVGYAPVGLSAGVTRKGGQIDLVVANRCGKDASCKSQGTATLLYGDGTGSFRTASESSIGNHPSSIALADLSGTGTLDLAVTHRDDATIAVSAGKGDGTFGAATFYSVGSTPSAMTVADLNGDGKADLAIANAGDSTVTVLYGSGTGIVRLGATLPVSTAPTAITAIPGTRSATASLATTNGVVGSGATTSNVTVLSSILVKAQGVTASTTSLTATPATTTVNPSAAVTIDAKVSGASGTPTGTVDITSNGTPGTVCSAIVLDGTGGASCTTSMLEQNVTTLTASYNGDATYAPATGSTSIVVNAATPTVTLVGAPASPSPLNTSVLFTATLTGVSLTPVAPTGTMTFALNGTTVAICTATVSTAGVATCAIQDMTSGSNTVTATYSGDPNFVVASPGSATYSITAQHPTVTIAAAPASPSAVNTDVTFTASLTGTALTPVLPNGTMTFALNGTTVPSCAGKVSAGGIATCSIQNMPAGSNTVTATYSGDTNYVVSAAGSTPYTTAASTASLTISASPGSSVTTGTAVTFSATLGGVAFTPVVPNGNVAFTLNGSPVATCSAVSVTNQTASCTIQSLVAPADTITATYSGDANFKVTNPATFTESVTQGATTVVLTSSQNPSSVNHSITFSATVPASPGQTAAPYPTGSVKFTQGATTLCGGPQVLSAPTLPLSPTNQPTATCTTTFSSATTYPVVATYSGDSNFTPGTAGSLTETINAGATTTSVTTSGTTIINQPVVVSASVVAVDTGTTIPQGTVSFTTTASVAPTGTCAAGVTIAPNGGVPTCTMIFSGAGTFDITAKFTPSNTNFATSTSSATQQTISAGTAGINLTSALNPSAVNQQVTFTAAFNPPITGTQPNGTMTFTDGSTTLCSVTVTAGAASTCSKAFTSAGAHSVSASFASTDANFNPGNSNTLTQTVAQTATTTAVVSANPSSSVNQVVAYTATVTPAITGAASPTGTVTFNAVSGAQNLVLCSSPQTLSTTAGSTTASCSAALPVNGSWSVTAIYGGDGNFTTSTSPAITQSVGKTVVTMTGISATAVAVINNSIAFTATLTPSISGSTAPTGSVAFSDGGVQLCGGPIAVSPASGGSVAATCPETFALAGTHNIAVTYSGDANFAGANAASVVTVAPSPTVVTLTSSSPTIRAGQSTIFTAIVTPAQKGVTSPSGVVTFASSDNTVSLACGPIAAAGKSDGTSVATCQATFKHDPTLPGQISVTAAYSSDSNANGVANFENSNGNTVQTVQDFTVSFAVSPITATSPGNISSSSAVYITQGYANTADNTTTPATLGDPFNPATITVVIRSSAGFSDALSATCAVIGNTSNAAVSDPSCKLSNTNPSGSTGTSLTYLVSASAKAPADSYSVTVTLADQISQQVSLSQSTTPLNVYVMEPSASLALGTGGASGTESALFLTPAPLTGTPTITCPLIWDAVNMKFSSSKIGCSGPAGTITTSGLTTTIPITISTGTTTASAARTSNIYLAGMFGLPVLALFGWLGAGRSQRRNLLRLLSLLLLALGISCASGCGGSFNPGTTGTTQTGIAAGSYLVQVVATDSSGNKYYAEVPLVVNAQ